MRRWLKTARDRLRRGLKVLLGMSGVLKFAAQPLVDEVLVRMNDPADAVDAFTVRRYLRGLQDVCATRRPNFGIRFQRHRDMPPSAQ
jgi:hypothetical protein